MDKYDVSLILACFNEEQIFEDSVSRIIRTLDQTDYTWEIIFVDDKAQDGTRTLIAKMIKRYPRKNLSAIFHKKNLGRGQTVKDGFKKALGRIVGYIDIDLEVGEWYLPKFFAAIEAGADLASAWRIYDFKLKTLHRWLGSKGYVLLRKALLGLPFEDTEGGYKFFKRAKLMPLLKQSYHSGWFFDTEIMTLAFRAGLKVVEIPTAFVRRTDKTSTVRLVPDTLIYLKNLLSYSYRHGKNH